MCVQCKFTLSCECVRSYMGPYSKRGGRVIGGSNNNSKPLGNMNIYIWVIGENGDGVPAKQFQNLFIQCQHAQMLTTMCGFQFVAYIFYHIYFVG